MQRSRWSRSITEWERGLFIGLVTDEQPSLFGLHSNSDHKAVVCFDWNKKSAVGLWTFPVDCAADQLRL